LSLWFFSEDIAAKEGAAPAVKKPRGRRRKGEDDAEERGVATPGAAKRQGKTSRVGRGKSSAAVAPGGDAVKPKAARKVKAKGEELPIAIYRDNRAIGWFLSCPPPPPPR